MTRLQSALFNSTEQLQLWNNLVHIEKHFTLPGYMWQFISW